MASLMIRSSAFKLELFSALAMAERRVLPNIRAAFRGMNFNMDTPSVAFYDAGSSDPAVCNFQGAVSFNDDPQYFVCGLTDDNDALNYCMTTDGVGSKPNVDYQMAANPNILFPTCGYPGEQSVAIA